MKSIESEQFQIYLNVARFIWMTQYGLQEKSEDPQEKSEAADFPDLYKTNGNRSIPRKIGKPCRKIRGMPINLNFVR